MGILYLAAFLRSRMEADFLLVNQRVEKQSVSRLVRMARDFGADVAGFTVLTPMAHTLPALAGGIREALPKALILAGGPHVSAVGADVLRVAGIDAAVPGEGELAFEQIIRRHLDGAGLGDVPGIHWRDADGGAVSNPGRIPFIEDLDSLPFPAYDLMDLRPYWRQKPMPLIARYRYISLYSSRGCPYHCHWCHRVFGDKFRAHSAARVAEEAEHFSKTYGVDNVEFLDDIFNYDPKRVHAIHGEFERRGLRLKIAFPNGLRSDLLTRETMDCLADMGTRYISFALETGSPRLQKLLGKHLNIPRLLNAVEMAVDRGIFSNGFVMLGLPTETAEEMRQTIDVATGSRLHTALFFTLLPFPGTQVYRYAQEHKPDLVQQLNFDDLNYAVSSINLSEVSDRELLHYQRLANVKFYSKPSRICRIVRDFPQRHLLPKYLPIFMYRVTKGLIGG